ncbi:hypothetical protein LEN26_010091 [Aphanomyces euteiches]|nr:hypothetical protein AeMF1_018912 [Aphanomyces euteiches]KAH9122791.1 hypothetical protein LEN26_010091 [Aphanomyces euteiches]
MTTEAVEVDAVAWALLEGYPWWPVYVFDAKKVRLKFHLLGSRHAKITKKARQFPDQYRLIYFFGSHDMSIVKNKPMFIQKWLCTKHESFLGGFPKVYFKRDKDLAGNLTMAYQEVVNYLARDAATRTLPLMVPSDTDPSLEPPSNPIRALQHQDSCMTREIDDHDEMLKKAKEKIKSTKRSGSDATGSTPHKKVKTSVVVESKHSDHGQSQAH